MPTVMRWTGASRLAVLAVGAAMLVASCGYDHDQWHGKSRSELIHAWGSPLEERRLTRDRTWLTVAYTQADTDSTAPCYMVYELDSREVVRSSFTIGC